MELTDLPQPHPGPEDVKLRVEAAGLCTTDLHVIDGHFPATTPVVLGHEFAGRVVEVGEKVTSLTIGDRVAVDPARPCGRCVFCRRGDVELCSHFSSHGSTCDGGLAQFVVIHESQAFKTVLAGEAAALVEPLTCVLHAARAALPHKVAGGKALVLGAGTSGLMFVQALQVMGGMEVHVLDRNEDKRALAQRLGAAVGLTSGADGAAVGGGGQGYDLVVDTTGHIPLVQASMARMGPKGAFLLYSVPHPQDQLTLNAFDFYRRELRIVGAFAGPHQFPTAVDWLERGLIKSAPLISHRFPIEAFGEAEALLRRGGPGVRKILMLPWSGDDSGAARSPGDTVTHSSRDEVGGRQP